MCKGPSLPAEIWLQVFKDVAQQGCYDTIARCGAVCRVFKEWTRDYLHEMRVVTFDNKEQVERIEADAATNQLQGWPGPMRVTIRGEKDTKAIPHLATLASRFAGRWTRMEHLFIRNAAWPLSLRAADAAAFASITFLFLDEVTFASVVTFGTLVSALPRLEALWLHNVKFARSSFLFDPRTISNFRLLPQAKSLQDVYMGAISSPLEHEFNPAAWAYYTELLDFISAVSNRCGKSPRVFPWGSVRRVDLYETTWWKFSSSSITRLLHALPSLEALRFTGSRSSLGDSDPLRITAVSLHHRLSPIVINVQCADAQPLHGAHIIRCLMKMDYPLRITQISTPVYSPPQGVDTVAIAINEMVRHAGSSLDHLALVIETGRRGKDSLPDQHRTLVGAANQYHDLDLSENSSLKSLSIHDQRTSCVGVCDILSRVTSRCVSCVEIKFDYSSCGWRNQAELSNGLSQLDAVLSRPVFDNLVHVPISARFQQHSMSGKERIRACWIKSCLRRLDQREIIGINIIDGEKLGLIWSDETNSWKRYVSKMDENGNADIVEVPAFEGGAVPEAITAYTAWKSLSGQKD